LRPLEDLEFFQVQEESVKLRREHRSRQIGREEDLDHWFSRPGRRQEKRIEEEIDNHWISFRNLISRWIGRRRSEFSLWRMRKRRADLSR
jgi:hypothetical protein